MKTITLKLVKAAEFTANAKQHADQVDKHLANLRWLQR